MIVPELLDVSEPREALASLRDITRINRYFGGHSTLGWMLRELVNPAEEFSLLDVGAASGDMGEAIRTRYPKARITALDRKQNHLAAAQGAKIVGDAFRLPFAPGSFDFVFSSLFLHHFEDPSVVELLIGFARCARRAVLAIDLERGPLAYRFVPATRWLFGWDPITLFDAPASVQAAFKQSELLDLAKLAGLPRARVRVHRPWSRLSLIAPV